jgi:nitrogen fixation protein NifT
MKVTVRREKGGAYSLYVAKKDLETRVIEAEQVGLWGGKVTLDNGWQMQMPAMPADTPLPVTVEARRLEA